MCVSENVVYPIVPNGFADHDPYHYPYYKWLAIIGNINPTFSGPNLRCLQFDNGLLSPHAPRLHGVALGELHQRNGFWTQFCHALPRLGDALRWQSHAGSLQTASDQLLAVEAIRCCIWSVASSHGLRVRMLTVESILSKLRLGYTVMPPIFLNLVSMRGMFWRSKCERLPSDCRYQPVQGISTPSVRVFLPCSSNACLRFAIRDLHNFTYIPIPIMTLCLVLHSGMDDHYPYMIFWLWHIRPHFPLPVCNMP